ncbi:MAG: wax ester/triacylglycerol synthase domain-containing protein [Actinomycetota bacterium]
MTDPRPDERMSDIDALVWAVEHEPRNRTTIAALARFDRPLDRAALRHRVDRASRVVARLRQRVVQDPSGLGAPRWSVDPEFRLAHHLRWLQLSDGSDQNLVEVVRDLIVQPFDRAHPLWEFTVVSGLSDGGSALLLKAHHAVSDGVGGVEMMLELFDLEPIAAPERAELPEAPVAADETITVADSVKEEAARWLGTARSALDALTSPRSADDLVGDARRLGRTLGAAYQMFRPGEAASGVPTGRSAGLELRFFAVDLDDLKAAGRRVGGTINTAFVAAVALGVGDHHEIVRDGTAGPLRVSIPISTRTDDEQGGNHWTPARIEVEMADGVGPDEVAAEVLHASAGLKDDPSHTLVPVLATALRPIPDSTTASLFGTVSSGIDIAASNVPGSPIPLYLCGAPVRELIPFGPLSGSAVNVTLMSYAGTAHIGVAADPAAIDDVEGLTRSLRDAFTAVIKGS